MNCRSALPLRLLTGLASLLLAVPFGYAQETTAGQSLDDALLNGKAHLNVRYRYEFVDQDGFAEDAHASTLLLRLNYQTGAWRGWSGFTEFDYIGELLVNDFNSGAGTSSANRSQFPVVADPKGADLNQLYVDYGGFADTRLRVGRQRIVLDDQRFVGGVAWRQNEQTYDAVSAVWKGAPNTEVFYAYVANVNRIFGERVNAGDHDADIHLLNGQIDLNDQWALAPYLYYIDNNDLAAFSTATYGIRADGRVPLDNSALALGVEIASQADAGNNPANYDALYYRLNVAWKLEGDLELGLGLESLGGDQFAAGEAFRTPLATLHKFQGWADKFLATPNAGIDDIYVWAKQKYRKWTLQAVYHDFSAEDGSADWGNEFNLSASLPLGDRYSLLLKAALFNTDNAAFTDTTKFWIQVAARY